MPKLFRLLSRPALGVFNRFGAIYIRNMDDLARAGPANILIEASG
jgi:hypothetical protein